MNRDPDLAGVFSVLSEMISENVISDYAVGGAVAAIFYVEPRDTFDLDIFFLRAVEPSSPLMRLESIYDFARRKNFECEAEFIRIQGWAVQFLEAASPLWRAAVVNANSLEFSGVPARVIQPEYLAAMMVEVGRNKDWLRLADFVDSDCLDEGRFTEILLEFGLLEKWKANKWRIDESAS